MEINDSKDEDVRSVDSVEDATWQPARDGTPHLSIDDLVLHRVQANAIQKGIDPVHERTAEPRALSFIPSSSLPYVRLGLPPENQPVRHRSRRISSRAVSHASASVGVSLCCRMRSSSR